MKSIRNTLLSAFIALAALSSSGAFAASIIYDSFYTDLFAGNIVPASDTTYCILVSASEASAKGTHAKRSDISTEVTGTGYTAGGVACTITPSVNTSTHLASITITGPSWSSATISAVGMVVYKHRGGAASADNLYYYIDFGGTVSSTASTYQVTVTSPFSIQN